MVLKGREICARPERLPGFFIGKSYGLQTEATPYAQAKAGEVMASNSKCRLALRRVVAMAEARRTRKMEWASSGALEAMFRLSQIGPYNAPCLPHLEYASIAEMLMQRGTAH